MENKDKGFEILKWENIRDFVRTINPEFAAIIDKISPSNQFPLIKASYQFGDLIVKDGVTHLPYKANDLRPIHDISFKKTISDLLSYTTIPLFLTLKNANEVFINSLTRSIPLNLFYPGSLLGLFETVDFMFGRESSSKWCVSAGAKNLITLPKINEISGFKKLKIAFDLDFNLERRYLSDHWKLFYHIARHPNFSQPWHNDVIFFTRKWFDYHKDPAWFEFKDYLCRHAWQQAQFAISKVGLNLTWEHFADAISARHLKPPPYLADQIKHIMLVAAGRWTAFRPADTSDQIAPVDGLQKALVDIYMLKKYLPTMMHVCSLEKDIHIPKYYSLSYPTLLEGSPKNYAVGTTLMIDLRAIKHLIDTITPVFQDTHKVSDGTFNGIQFNYFHVEKDKYGEIKQSTELVKFDEKLLIDKEKYPNREFCTTSQFWRGCIRISPSTL